ncbi:hypothetical protein [Nocardia wallacei]|uniref:hypothetical protein n=1 Tax=Nocardia wallacei TaxID=480035 RepID=UPI0024578312|nr:hypothetical protein [Nocardia wallacei]
MTTTEPRIAAAQPVRACACGSTTLFGRGMCSQCYNRARYRAQLRRTWTPDRTDAGPTREHLDRLQRAGLRNYQIARLSGVDASVLSRLPEVEHVRHRTEAKILAVPVPDNSTDVVDETAKVPSVGAVRRVQALIASGYPQAELGRQLGIDKANMRALTGRVPGGKNTGEWVTAARHRQVTELFDRLQMTPGPSQQARELGKRMGWALPFEWDEDALDDPKAKPVRGARWKPESARAERTNLRAQRRQQVQELTQLGLPASEIAQRLHVTVRTVERDRRRAHTGAQQAAAQGDATSSMPVPYDSAERRAATADQLRATGLSDKQIARRMAVDAGHARPAQTAVGNKPGPQAKPRSTQPSSGVYRGRDQRGYGK